MSIARIVSGIVALGFILVLIPTSTSAAERMAATFTKEPTKSESGLKYRYTFKVNEQKSGKPVEGAQFMISTDMPSMPGAHHMPHQKAEPGDNPGTYHATVDFGMPGQWTLILKFFKPYRDQLVLTDMIEKESIGKHSGHMHGGAEEKPDKSSYDHGKKENEKSSHKH